MQICCIIYDVLTNFTEIRVLGNTIHPTMNIRLFHVCVIPKLQGKSQVYLMHRFPHGSTLTKLSSSQLSETKRMMMVKKGTSAQRGHIQEAPQRNPIPVRARNPPSSTM